MKTKAVLSAIIVSAIFLSTACYRQSANCKAATKRKESINKIQFQ